MRPVAADATGGGGSSPDAGSSPEPKGPAPSANPADMVQALQQLGIKADPNSPLARLTAMMNRPEPHFAALTPGDPSVYSGPLVFQPGMTFAL